MIDLRATLVIVASAVLIVALSPASVSCTANHCPRRPRAVACGAVTCTGSQTCCSREGACVDPTQYCPSGSPGPYTQCASADDCAEGNVCCETENVGLGSLEFACAAACDSVYGFQVCRQECECPIGKTCVISPGSATGDCQ